MRRRIQGITKDHFGVVWYAFNRAPRAPQRPFADVRLDARIHDLLSEISVAPNGEIPLHRELDPNRQDAPLDVEQPVLQALERYIELTHWEPHQTPAAVAAADWLSASEKIE